MASVMVDDHDYLHHQALQAWGQLAQESPEAITFRLQPWSELHPSLQRQLLREAIRCLRSSLRDITWSHVEQARVGVSQIGAGARITLPQGLFLFKRYEDFVIGEGIPYPDLPLLSGRTVAVEIPGSTVLLASAWVLHSRIVNRQELTDEILQNPDPWQVCLDLGKTGTDLALRTRQRGDRLQPLGMGGRSKSLNDFMVDAKIPQHVRDSLPLVVCPRHIVWVAGHRIDERAKITSQTRLILHLRFVRAA
jgi:tRNA(Ile)-lysidine synthase